MKHLMKAIGKSISKIAETGLMMKKYGSVPHNDLGM